MAYRIMIVVEDVDYLPEYNPGVLTPDREVHPSDAGWHGWTGLPGDMQPAVFNDYEEALAQAEALTVAR